MKSIYFQFNLVCTAFLKTTELVNKATTRKQNQKYNNITISNKSYNFLSNNSYEAQNSVNFTVFVKNLFKSK